MNGIRQKIIVPTIARCNEYTNSEEMDHLQTLSQNAEIENTMIPLEISCLRQLSAGQLEIVYENLTCKLEYPTLPFRRFWDQKMI